MRLGTLHGDDISRLELKSGEGCVSWQFDYEDLKTSLTLQAN